MKTALQIVNQLLREDFKCAIREQAFSLDVSFQRNVLFMFINQYSAHVWMGYFYFLSKDWDDQKVKTAIKKLLEHYSQTHLERMLCPFSQVTKFLRDTVLKVEQS